MIVFYSRHIAASLVVNFRINLIVEYYPCQYVWLAARGGAFVISNAILMMSKARVC